MLTDLQKKKFTHLFHCIDVNKDGVIDHHDYERVTRNLAEARGFRHGSAEFAALEQRQLGAWNQLSAQLDPKHGGKLKLDAWLAMHEGLIANKAMYDHVVTSTAEFFFHVLDANGDNKISVDEYKMFLRAYEIQPGEWTEKTFKACDHNGDGFLTKDEMLRVTHEFHHSNDPAAPGNHFFGPF